MTDARPDSPSRITPALVGKLLGSVSLAAILAMPTPAGMTAEAQRLLAVTALMLCFWLTSAVPIAVTSLIPLSAFPLLGILSAEAVSRQYIGDAVFLYFGGFVIALGIEKWGLHRRIALNTVRLIGSGPRTIVLGFMLASGFLSMWISNTATTLMMLPIGLALLTSLREVTRDTVPDSEASLQSLEVPLLLGIAYASSIGGMITTVGTPTNVTFLQVYQDTFPGAPSISTGIWISSFLPMGVAFILLSWLAMTWRIRPGVPLERNFFRDEVRKLGPMSRGERLMLLIFVATALLWMFRKDLNFGIGPTIPGWDRVAQWFLRDVLQTSEAIATSAVNDSTVAMFMCVAMFLIPVRRAERGDVQYLMDWETLNRMPWGILLLFGGGFALAEAFKVTQLAEWFGSRGSELLAGQELWILVAGVCFVMTFLTEFTTNVATVSAMLPVLAATSLQLGIDPRIIMISATISTSCAFMLPIATPPNAIVFSSGRLSPKQMAAHGLVLNLIGVALVTLATFRFVIPQFGIDVDARPEWARAAEVGGRR